MSFFNLNFEQLQKVEDTSTYDFEAIRNKTRIDRTKKQPKPEPLISIGGRMVKGKYYDTYVCTKGEMSAIVAPSKTFKSMLSSALIACFMGGENSQRLFPSIKSFKKEECTIIHLDTEQGNHYAESTFRRTEKIYGELNVNYDTYAMRSVSAEYRVRFIDDLLKNQNILYNHPIKFIIVDGIADLVDDTNDIRMSKEVSDYVMRWTNEYGIHILTVIHKNHGSDKPVGHLGSFVVKKAETVFLLEQDKDFSTEDKRIIKVNCSYSRGASFDPFWFTIDKEAVPYEWGVTEIQNEEPKFLQTQNNLDVQNHVVTDLKMAFDNDNDVPF